MRVAIVVVVIKIIAFIERLLYPCISHGLFEFLLFTALSSNVLIIPIL